MLVSIISLGRLYIYIEYQTLRECRNRKLENHGGKLGDRSQRIGEREREKERIGQGRGEGGGEKRVRVFRGGGFI